MSATSARSRRYRQIFKAEKERCRTTGGKCWICHRKIDCSIPSVEKWGFSLDHVDPTVFGGDLERLANLKWAHKRCNSRRGDGTNKNVLITSRKW